MEGHVEPGAYKDLVLFLATAAVVVPLFRRWRISPILGFLAAGVLLGPHGLGRLSGDIPALRYFTVDNPEEISQLAEFGVVFLMFMIGLELSWERLRLMRRFVFGLGAAQVALCLTVIACAALALGHPLATAAAVGAALALSSTAIVMPILTEQKRQHSPAGRATFSVLLFQDLAVAPILVTLAVIGGGDAEELRPSMLLAFAPAAIALFALVLGARLLLRPMFRSVARAKSEELFMAACLLVVLGAGMASAFAGLSMGLGAFVAGLLLAETEFRHEVEVTIEPFKGLLLGLFFVSVGIQLDVSLLLANPLPILGIAAGMIVLKTAAVAVLARASRLPRPASLEAALLLAGGGEFAFVILTTAMGEGVVPAVVGHTVLVAATLSMMVIPALAWAGVRIGRGAQKLEDIPAEPVQPPSSSPKVLIVGYGRVGKLVAEMLSRHELSWIAAERDTRLVESARRAGHPIFYGDAARPELLKRCGLDEVRALVVTMDDPEAVEAVVAAARQLRSDLAIVARARDARQAQRLYELGATDAVPETVEASLQLSETVLVETGVPMGLIIASIHERRDEFRKALNRPDALGGRTRRARRSAG